MNIRTRLFSKKYLMLLYNSVAAKQKHLTQMR